MLKNKSRFILARHGETFLNLEHRWQGMGDSLLTEEGVKQAELLGREMKSYHVSRIITSQLQRARQTGNIVAGINGIRSIRSTEFLNERNLGILEGLTSDEIREKFGVDFRVITSTDIDEFERVEPWKSFVGRIFSYLEELHDRNYEGTTLLLAHGGVMRAVYNTLTNSNEQKVVFFNCSYMMLHRENRNFTIDSISAPGYSLSLHDSNQAINEDITD